MAIRGVDVLIYVNTGTDTSPVWTVVGGQRGATLSEEVETIDVTTKNSPAGTREEEPTVYSWTLSCEGICVEDDTALQKLKQTIRQRGKVKVRIKEGDTFTEEGLAIPTSLERESPHDDVATYSVELKGVGPLNDNPTP